MRRDKKSLRLGWRRSSHQRGWGLEELADGQTPTKVPEKYFLSFSSKGRFVHVCNVAFLRRHNGHVTFHFTQKEWSKESYFIFL
jgi:hypothetical protein